MYHFQALNITWPVFFLCEHSVVVCDLYLSEKTYGEKGANAGAKRCDDICHLGLYFFCCGVNDRLGLPPAVRFRGIFEIFIPKG